MSHPGYLTEVRAGYDAVAVEYAERLRSDLERQPLARALFAAFAELVRASGNERVADLGCGPGHVTAHLRGLGLAMSGIDLSPSMVEVARRAYPGVPFDEGSMSDLDWADGALGGIVAWYSIIHIPPDELPALFAEFRRVLAPGGYVLLAFQVGDERIRVERAYGRAVSLDAHRLPPDLVADSLARAGLPVVARLVREPNETEKVPQAHLLARRPE
jgi:SAM-dependent methyltransferase